MKKFDAIIIGTGQAGPPLASSLAKNGLQTAIIEKRELGGTCVNTGCTPTKAYVASARRAFIARNSREMGVNIEGHVQVDLKTIKARKDQLIADSHEGLERTFEKEELITLFRGKAVFLDDHTILVNGEELTAEKIFINVGGRPRVPKDFEAVNYLTNRSMLELEEVPKNLVIVGGGYVGLEFAQMFSRFGSEVTILERGSALMKKEDDDIAEAITEIIKESGINVLLNSDCIKAAEKNGEIEVTYNCEAGSKKITTSHLLLAVGRVPNTNDLGLEKTGVELDDHGFIKVNDELQTSVSHIWALGDCNGEGAFTHTAYNDFQIVNSTFYEDRKRKLSDRFPCYAAYIDPPLARVGLDEKQIKAKGIKAKVAEMPMKKVARAKEKGETAGKMKIFIDADTDKILGATFLGTGADEYIHTVIDQMYAGATYQVMRDAVHIHPTVSELIPTMLENLREL
ncbi:FAD-containing oxidoreductase [Salinimicrobium sp. MT39]|uniref:FAD-containing oxidoreductase n=1 Tax=Salinimicrobium profundisediminis TaxID=2994553 RepID=A0A9X3CYE1_9FLAO|nr:FAD-containing oxidoreductase [Salinimicrobium profundisediminis]MCX2839126.1 FAD-containing oxidoreductase [Salinimicrobium profundisediminis]